MTEADAALAGAQGRHDVAPPGSVLASIRSRVGGLHVPVEPTRGRESETRAGSHWGLSFAYGELASDRLIHMNGRVYDYRLGRFLSVDPIISNPLSSQAVNPYSYIGNNPLSGTDPTGYDVCSADRCSGTQHGATRPVTVTGTHIPNTVPAGPLLINGSPLSGNVVSGPATNGAPGQGSKTPTVNSAEHGNPQDTAKSSGDNRKEWPFSVVGTEEWTNAWAATHGGSVIAPQFGDNLTLAGQSWEFGKNPEQDAIFIKYYVHLANQKEDSAVIGAAMVVAGGVRIVGAAIDAALARAGTTAAGSAGTEASALKTTAHGAERIAGEAATRGGVLSAEQVAQVRAGGQVMRQADGATVRFLQADGRFNVVIEGEKGIITTFRNLSQRSFDRLAKNYGWRAE